MSSITIGSTSGSRPYCILTVNQSSQNIAENKTTVSYSLVLKRPSAISSSATKSWSVTINGTTHNGSGTIGGSGDKMLLSGTQVIPHNNDGTKAISFSGSAKLEITWGSTWMGTISGSGSMNLTTIPRASSVSTSASGTYPNSGITMNISRASSSFTHTLSYSCGSSSGTIATGIATSYTWNVPASLIMQSPNANQTCTITCYTYSGGSHIGTKTTSFTVYYYTPSTISSVSGNTLGSVFSMNISRKSGLFTHSLWYTFGIKTWQGIGSSLATSASFTPPLSLCGEIPNATSGSMAIILRTYYGSQQIGSDQYTYYPMNVPSSIVPSLTDITCKENVSEVAELVGAYVQNKTKLSLAIIGASGTYGSTIKSYKITVAGQTINAASGTTSTITLSGNQIITAVITDSRGRTASRSKTISLLGYKNPMISGTDVERTDDTTALVSASLTATSLKIQGIEKNHLIYKVEYKAVDAHSYIIIEGSFQEVTQVLNKTITGLNTDKSYEFKIYIGDVFGYDTTYEIGRISTAFKSFDFDIKNGRLGIKKVLEYKDSVIEIPEGSKLYLGTKSINLDSISKPYRVGDIIISINSENPSKIYGGTWELLCPGRTLVCIDANDVDFNNVKKIGGSKYLQSHTHTGTVASNGAHNHSVSISSAGAHTHSVGRDYDAVSSASGNRCYSVHNTGSSGADGQSPTSSSGSHTHTGTIGSNGAHTHSISLNSSGSGNTQNLQPFMTVYMWVKIN